METNDKIEIPRGIDIKWRVDIVKDPRQGDVFLYGVDDFKPQIFESEYQAVHFIHERAEGNYTITKLYCRK